MDDSEKGTPIKVKFSDKRRVRPDAEAASVDESSSSERAPDEAQEMNSAANPEQEESSSAENDETSQDYLDDLRRVQADFDNYRKRMLREQTQLAQRASARLVERLLPVLDNFESAIDHGEGGNGVELVYKELRRVLEEEGLTEIPAEGEPFDPRVHEAFEAVEDEAVSEPTVRSVLRRGYTLKEQVLRPSMVSVARPPDAAADTGENTEATGDAAGADEQDAAEG